MLFDGKRKVISENGRKMCEKLGIEPESLLNRRIESFEAQDGDKEMA